MALRMRARSSWCCWFMAGPRLALWERGEEGAAEVWDAAPVELRRRAIMHLVISYSAAVGYGGRRLSPAETVSLVRQAFPASPLG